METSGKGYFKKEAHVYVIEVRSENAHWLYGKEVTGVLGQGKWRVGQVVDFGWPKDFW